MAGLDEEVQRLSLSWTRDAACKRIIRTPSLIVVINEGRIIVTDDDSAVGQWGFVPKGVKDIKHILEGVRK
jgi:hypothetical protein